MALLEVRDVIQNGRHYEMAVILDFTKNSNLSEKCEITKLQITFARVVKYDTIKHFASFSTILFYFYFFLIVA